MDVQLYKHTQNGITMKHLYTKTVLSKTYYYCCQHFAAKTQLSQNQAKINIGEDLLSSTNNGSGCQNFDLDTFIDIFF